jgi:hypothetical protein
MSRAAKVLGLCCALLIGAAAPAWALEPVEVTVEAAVDAVSGESAEALRKRLLERALEQAVLDVAGRYVAPERLALEGERLREALRPKAAGFILTYRVDQAPQTRRSPQDPGVEQQVLLLTATVDAERLRRQLQELGFGAAAGSRPSVAIFEQLLAPRDAGGSAVSLSVAPLREFVARALSEAGFVVVEPALYAGARVAPASAVELARGLGADLGVDLEVRWSPRPGPAGGSVSGGVAEVQVRSLRARDATELAAGRFEAPGYGPDGRAAFGRALDSLRDQVAKGLVFQLEQNLSAIQVGGNGVVRLRLTEVAGLAQVEAVQKTLTNTLGASSASLLLLEPRTAELAVESDLSPGVLQERLLAGAYPGFGLELAGVQSESIELRVRPEPAGPPLDGQTPVGPRTN